MATRGAGSVRQRSPHVWEVRVSVGTDAVSGRSVYRSRTVHGELAEAEQQRHLLAAQAEQLRACGQRPLRTVANLLEVWLAADHDWKPSTWQNYRQASRRLSADPLARRAPATVSPPVLRAAMTAWQKAGVPTSTSALHVRTLKAAVGWAFDQRLLACQPLQGMRGPGQPAPRRDINLSVVRDLLRAADADVTGLARLPPSPGRDRRLHTAEQVRLLLRLAADPGARRGELDALHVDDLHDRALHIDRGVSAEIVTTTKTGRTRRVTVGAGTARLWQDTVSTWRERLPPDQRLGPWLFSADIQHRDRLRCSTSATGSRTSSAATTTPTCACTGFGTPSRPSPSPKASCCTRNSASATPRPQPPCGSTATRSRSTTKTSPTTSTGSSTAIRQPTTGHSCRLAV